MIRQHWTGQNSDQSAQLSLKFATKVFAACNTDMRTYHLAQSRKSLATDKWRRLGGVFCSGKTISVKQYLKHKLTGNKVGLTVLVVVVVVVCLGSLLFLSRIFRVPKFNTGQPYCTRQQNTRAQKYVARCRLSLITDFYMTSLKYKLQNYWSSWDFTFTMHKSS